MNRHQKTIDHLIDIQSGKVIEFTNDEIERLQAEVAEKLGYRLVDHRLGFMPCRSMPKHANNPALAFCGLCLDWFSD